MDPIDPTNQSNSTNHNLTNQLKKRLSSKTVVIISTLFAIISSYFIALANTGIYESIFGVKPAGLFTGIEEFMFIGGLSAIIWIPAFIVSARKAHYGSGIAKLILTIMLIYFPIAIGLISYFNHLKAVEFEKFIKEDIIRTYNHHVEDDVENYQRAAIKYCYYTGHLPETLEEISSLPQLSYFRLTETGLRNIGFNEGNYYYDPKIVYNLKNDSTGFSVNGTFIDGTGHKESFDIPTGGCSTITPFKNL